MKLYTAKLSPFAARCRMQIYAKGIEIEFVEYPTAVSKQQLLELSPLGKIPILTVGDAVLPESETICEYLEDCERGRSLRPDDALVRARMRLLSRVADLYVFEALNPLFAHLSRKRRQQEAVDQGIGRISTGLLTLERFIGEGRYAVADQLSLADCCLAPILLFVTTYLPYFDLAEPLQDYPRLSAYWAAIQGDPHAARVIAEIRQGIAEKAGGGSGKSPA